METQKLLKKYKCESISGYYDLIIEAYFNGHKQDVMDYFRQMNVFQRKSFMSMLIETARGNGHLLPKDSTNLLHLILDHLTVIA